MRSFLSLTKHFLVPQNTPPEQIKRKINHGKKFISYTFLIFFSIITGIMEFAILPRIISMFTEFGAEIPKSTYFIRYILFILIFWLVFRIFSLKDKYVKYKSEQADNGVLKITPIPSKVEKFEILVGVLICFFLGFLALSVILPKLLVGKI